MLEDLTGLSSSTVGQYLLGSWLFPADLHMVLDKLKSVQ
jgi:HD-like signal output (HDOD) protein